MVLIVSEIQDFQRRGIAPGIVQRRWRDRPERDSLRSILIRRFIGAMKWPWKFFLSVAVKWRR